MLSNVKKVVFGAEARQRMVNGVNILADAVAVTLGPRGRNVVIQNQYGSPTITKDGVSVAKEIFLEDPLENMGAQMVKEVASRTAGNAGDGTTTATVLAQAIVKEGMKYVTAGLNPTDLKRGIDLATSSAIDALSALSVPCETADEIAQVGTISANGDASIGKMISDAMGRVGTSGVITVENGNGLHDELVVVEGMQFDHGYISPYFITNQQKQSIELIEPFILLVDSKISHIREMIPLLEAVSQTKRPLLIIADEIDGEALATLIVNNARGVVSVAAVKSPGYGEFRKGMMADLAILTGATLIAEELGLQLESSDINVLGMAARVEITKDNTTIIDGSGDAIQISERIATLRGILEESTDPYERHNTQSRLAKLSGGIAVIRVGASSELEMKEKADRIDDALHATKAAVEDGIVPGGGVALIRAFQSIHGLRGANADQDAGIQIVLQAIQEPLRRIVLNAGESPDVVFNHVASGTGNFGYNAATEQYVDLVEAGVIDPTKVTKTALTNAASVAGLLLTADCAIHLAKTETK